jgi:hypothetical protein
MVSRPAAWISRGPAPARPAPPSPECRAAPKATEQPPSTRKPVIMIHGSRASGAASPLICTSVAERPVCSSEAATQAAVNATGPAIPATAPNLVPVPRAAGRGGSSLRRVRMIIAG